MDGSCNLTKIEREQKNRDLAEVPIHDFPAHRAAYAVGRLPFRHRLVVVVSLTVAFAVTVAIPMMLRFGLRFLVGVLLGVLALLPLLVRLMLVEPVRMMRFDPVAMIGRPPIAIVPFVVVVPI